MSKLEDKLIDTFDKLEGYLTEMTPIAYELAVRGAFYSGLTRIISSLFFVLLFSWACFYIVKCCFKYEPVNSLDETRVWLVVAGAITFMFICISLMILFGNLHPVIDPESYLVWRMIK